MECSFSNTRYIKHEEKTILWKNYTKDL
jgi:hypothetical protein